jgi:hypothetical protein
VSQILKMFFQYKALPDNLTNSEHDVMPTVGRYFGMVCSYERTYFNNTILINKKCVEIILNA